MLVLLPNFTACGVVGRKYCLIKKGSVLQVLVDVTTPADVFGQVDIAVTEHFKANPKEYTGEKLVVANNATDPLKFTLCVFWEYSHPGNAKACYAHCAFPRTPTTNKSIWSNTVPQLRLCC